MICICVPIGSKTEPEFEVCLTGLVEFTALSARRQAAALSADRVVIEKRAEQLGTETLRIVGEPIVKARNLLTKHALEKGCTHILFIDADMSFGQESLARLVAKRQPVIGGLYFNRRWPYQPQILRRHDSSTELGSSLAFVYEYPEDALVECDGTGAGFLLVERRVFEAMEYGKWWNEAEGKSEDLSFCVRAQQAGFRIVVDTGLKLKHLASDLAIDEEFVRQFRRGYTVPRHNIWTGPRFRRAKRLPEEDKRLGGMPDVVPVPPEEFPQIAYVIPTRDAPSRFLRAAINSALDQDELDAEVIVVDDGSVATDPIPQGVNLIQISQPGERRGLAEALNTGIREAISNGAEWIFILEPTALANPERAIVSLSAASATGFDVVFSCLDIHVTENRDQWISPKIPRWGTLEGQAKALEAGGWVVPSSLCFHKSAWQTIGLFDPQFETLYVWDWCRRAAENKIFIYKLEETLGVDRRSINHRLPAEEGKRVANAATERARVKAEEQTKAAAEKAKIQPPAGYGVGPAEQLIAHVAAMTSEEVAAQDPGNDERDHRD